MKISIFFMLPEYFLICYIFYNLVSWGQKSFFDLYRWMFYFSFLLYLIVFSWCFAAFHSDISFINFYAYRNWSMLIFCSPYVLFCKGSLIFFSLVIFKSCENKFLLLQTNQIEFLTEFFVIISFSIFFMFLLLSSTDFFSIYLALEGLGFSVYVLASISTEGLIAIEGAIKYFVFGALSGALYLVGSIFLFGSIGCLDLDFIYFFLLTDKFVLFSTEILIGFLLIIIAFCFKIGAFPFHTWVVDIYEAVWLPVLAFFSIVVKASLFFALYRILFYAMFPVLFLFQHIFGIIACGSMVFGTVCALREYRLKRFFAYLSISQVGFIFLGIASCNLLGFMSSFIYLFLYTLMNLILFCCFLNVEHRVTGRSMIYITDLYGLISYNVNISRILSLVSFAMAGLPPFGGFFGKLFIYFAVMSSELDLYVGFSLCLSILSSYYYLNLARHIYADKSFSPKLYCFKYTYNWYEFTWLLSFAPIKPSFYFCRFSDFYVLLYVLVFILNIISFLDIFSFTGINIYCILRSCVFPLSYFVV